MPAVRIPLTVLDGCCCAREVLGLIANKWTMLIIRCLADGARRPHELMDAIQGVSQKMLTQTLRQLEQGGLVARDVHAVVPPRVDYTLTALGKTLVEPLKVICLWAETHGAELEAIKAKRGKPGRKSRNL